MDSRITAAAVALTAAAAMAAGAGSRHDRVVVVPAPKPPVLDGRLDEWDRSGQIECAYDEALRPRFTVRLCLMYDAKALYVGAHFADATPMRNRHDPAVEPQLGWAGDCLQLRLCSDPAAGYPLAGSNSDRICHLSMWYHTDKKQPVCQIQYGMDYHGTKVLTGRHALLAFAPDADAKGYTLEARVPFSRLNAGDKPPRAGQIVALVVQPLWSDAAGWKHAVTFNDVVRRAGFSFQDPGTWGQAIFSPHGRLKPAERPRTAARQLRPLRLKLPAADADATTVSAAIYDAGGTLVRSLPVLQADKPLGKAPALDWDGLDDDGRPLPVGSYSLRTLSHRGIGQRYLLSLHSAGTPPWRTDDGRGAWGGDHGPPVAAAADANRVYLGWTVSEAGWAVIAVEPDLPTPRSARKIWGQHQVLELGIEVQALATDGRRLFVGQDGSKWGDHEKASATAGVVIWEAATGRPVNFPFGKRALLVRRWATRGKAGLNLRGLAVLGEDLYVALHHDGKLLRYNWKTGKQVAAYDVPAAGGLAVARDGSLYAVSGRTVVRLRPAGAKIETVVAEGLSRPWGLAEHDGRLYITDRGDAMQVKVFADGKLAGTIGKPGGRPAVGRYDASGLYRPAGLAVDAKGRLWVAEEDQAPKRVSVWTADGRLVADLLGPGAYAVEGIADPRDPRRINTHHTLFEIDYEKRDWRIVATLLRPEPGQIQPFGGHMGRALLFRHARGRDYLVWRGHHLVIIYLLGKDLRARPVAATGWLKDTSLYGLEARYLPEEVRADAARRRHDYGFRWADRNGDYKLQPDELAVEKMPASPWGCYWGSWVDEDLTVWSSNRSAKAVWRIGVAEYLPGGVPLYPPPSRQKPLFALPDTANIHYVLPARGGVFLLEDLAGKGGAISLCRLDGTRRWSYRRVWTGFGLDSPLSQPGDVAGAMRFVGKVTLDGGRQLVAVNGYFGQFNLLSDDGLWVASLCKDNRYGPKADETTVWPENFSGWFYRSRLDGKVYLIAGDTDTRIWQVTGLEHLRAATGKLTITESDRAQALGAALRRSGLAADKPPLRLRPAANVRVDGRLDEWDLASAAAIERGGRRRARIALAYDAANLYAAFDVTDPSPMRNAGKDYALLFKTGDACELLLAADPKAPSDRRRPAGGDLRLLLSVLEDKPVAVLYEPVARSAKRQARVFSSPTGVESFDRVALLAEAKVALVRSAGGYRLEAAVPLESLGFAPRPGTFTRGDVGVIFSDAGGSRNTLRACYANPHTAIVNDIPTEARLEPHYWGPVRVEKQEARR